MNYTESLKELDLPTLKYIRFRGDLTEVYSIINQIGDLKLDIFFAPTKSHITRNADRSQIVCQIQ